MEFDNYIRELEILTKNLNDVDVFYKRGQIVIRRLLDAKKPVLRGNVEG